MKALIILVLFLPILSFCGCSDVSPDAVELKVDFTWEGLVPCAVGGNPEIRVGSIPDGTKTLVVTLYDHGMSHGNQKLDYDGTGIIKKGGLDQIEGPCPFADSGRYKFKIEAVDENEIIIGVGSRERYYPEKE
ncbi:MAG: hypothetical protein PVF29_02180 [Desulfobacterales bacterium]|jgi:hypothetical protein